MAHAAALCYPPVGCPFADTATAIQATLARAGSKAEIVQGPETTAVVRSCIRIPTYEHLSSIQTMPTMPSSAELSAGGPLSSTSS